MSTLLYDPPQLHEYASRGDPPYSAWPGTIRTPEDIMAACGDPRDWFRYGWRLEAYYRYWNEWADARARRRDLSADFDWDQVLIIGSYGAGKTTLAIKLALRYFRRGHAVFSNAACLIGWRLEHEEMYTALGLAPKHSVFLIDESSAALSSRMGGGVAVASWAEMCLNSRKVSAKVLYMSAQDWEIAPAIRRETRQVWMPVPKDKLQVVGDYYGVKPRNPAENPDNFRVAWFVWTDYPYRKGNIIEGKDKTADGFGPPDEIWYDEADDVRDAFLLTDTFELAQAGAARTADADTVKANLREFLGKDDPSTLAPARLIEWVQELGDLQEEALEYVTAAQIAGDLGVSEQKIGLEMRMCYPTVRARSGRGYQTEDLIGAEAIRQETIAGRKKAQTNLEAFRTTRPPDVTDVVEALRKLPSHERPRYVTASDIAARVSMNERAVGKAIKQRFGVPPTQRHGYLVDALIAALEEGE